MGNSSSSSSRSHDETVDFGYLVPQGVYTGPRDWNQAIVTQLIAARRLAPFYRPLEDYDDSWTDDQILAARKDPPDAEGVADPSTRAEVASTTSSLNSSSTKSSHAKRPGALKEPSKPEAAVYRGAVECPICFLYYPPNINHSRCCDQAICTECFVQIKRNEPTATHLVSEPAACPYCVQENFGVVYTPPPWRAGIGSEGSHSGWPSGSPKGSPQSLDTPVQPPPTHKRRQKSFGADNPEVVTIDQIRPDWEAKLAAVRAAVARRANRRIIMRQVGDRLIPVGVTSGRVHALLSDEAGADASENGNSGSRRSRRRPQAGNTGFEQYLGQDLEELMVMEAMRLSLLEHEEQQRKEAEEKKKNAKAGGESTDNAASEPNVGGSGSSTSAPNPTSSSTSAPNLNSIDFSSSPISTSPPSIPSYIKSDSLQAETSSLLPRSRSISPAPPANPEAQSGASSSTRTDDEPSNSPPLSSLAATPSSGSAAGIFLNGIDSDTPLSFSDEFIPGEIPRQDEAQRVSSKALTDSAAQSTVNGASLGCGISADSLAPDSSPSEARGADSSSSILASAPAASHSGTTTPLTITPNDSSFYETLPSSPEGLSQVPLIPKSNVAHSDPFEDNTHL